MARIKPHTNEIIRLYRSGKTMPEIARMYGATTNGVWLLLKRNGIERRSQAEVMALYWADPEQRQKRLAAISAGIKASARTEKAPRYGALLALSLPSDGRVHSYLMAMADGMSASEAAEIFNTTRNAVLGCVHRFSQSVARERAGAWLRSQDNTSDTATSAN